MKIEDFVNIIGSDFYTGVPDSQLKPLCNYLINTYGIDNQHHIIGANEGNCVAIAAGYHLSTGKYPVVYMQNSGEGNIINPVASLLNEKVYEIPMIFVVGWRGEPGVHDEPQHIFQGEVTLTLLKDMNIEVFVVDKDTTTDEMAFKMNEYNLLLSSGKDVAFVIKKGALSYDEKIDYSNDFLITREDIIEHITNISGEDPIICTTGKASRELFEIRERNSQPHCYDFLTVGSMGHSSSIALGIAISKPCAKIWCIDGDGAMLMHMGAMAVIGAHNPNNMVHIVINNCSHETVGGMPTVAGNMDIVAIAKACNYRYAISVNNLEDLYKELLKVKGHNELSLIEVKCAIGARSNLGRPTTTAKENKEKFMDVLKHL